MRPMKPDGKLPEVHTSRPDCGCERCQHVISQWRVMATADALFKIFGFVRLKETTTNEEEAQ
jgi:hypothetical protein